MRKRRSSAEGYETTKRKKHRDENFTAQFPPSAQVMENLLDNGPNPSMQGDETQKRKKHRDENFMGILPPSAQVRENLLDNDPNPSMQVVNENCNLQIGITADIRKQRNLVHSSESESEGQKFKTYSRRSSKSGHIQKKKNRCTSQENLQKIISHNKSSAIVKPTEADFWRKKNNDASFGESSLGVDGKEDGSTREGMPADRASTVPTDSDPNKTNLSDSRTNNGTRRRWRKKNKKASSNTRQVSVSDQEVIVSKESENIDSAKNDDLYPESLSKSHMKKEKNAKQVMPVKQDDSGVQMNSSGISVNNSDLHCSPRHSLKLPALKTYARKCKISGQHGKCPHTSSDNKHDLCNGSSSIINASEANFKRMENNDASFNESHSSVEKDGGPSMNAQTCPTNLAHSDINSNFHKVNRMDLGGTNKARWKRRKNKNKTPVCNNQNENMSVSVKSETIEAEKTGMDSEICSKSQIGNVKSNSGGIYKIRKIRAKEEMEMATVSKNGSLDNAQLCNTFSKMLKHKNEDFCQRKYKILIGEMSNGKDGESYPHLLVQGVTDDIVLDTVMKENITFDNMAVPLQRPLINDGKKKLLILDVNGLPVDALYERHPIRRPPIRVSGKSALAYGTSASQSFPALGVEWPDGPQFGLPLGSPEVAAQLVQSLDLLLQVDHLPSVEAMRSKLEERTRDYHAFGLPKDTWVAKLAALWDEFAHLHASQEERQRTKMMIQQEVELLRRLRATQADVHARIEAARDRGWRAAFRAKELQRKVEALSRQARVAEVECSSAQTELATLQLKFDGLQGKVLLSETRIAELRRKGP